MIIDNAKVDLSLLLLDHSNKKFCNATRNPLIHFFSLFFQSPNLVTVKTQVLTASNEGLLTKDLIGMKIKNFYTTDSSIHYTQRSYRDYMGFLKEYKQLKKDI